LPGRNDWVSVIAGRCENATARPRTSSAAAMAIYGVADPLVIGLGDNFHFDGHDWLIYGTTEYGSDTSIAGWEHEEHAPSLKEMDYALLNSAKAFSRCESSWSSSGIAFAAGLAGAVPPSH